MGVKTNSGWSKLGQVALGVGRFGLGTITGGLSEAAIAATNRVDAPTNPLGPAKKKKKKDSKVSEAEAKEEQLRQAVMARMDKRGSTLDSEASDMEKSLAAAAGRGAAAASGRRAGMASGGGKLRALSGIESDLSLQASEARAGIADKRFGHDLERLQFERETMKDSTQQKQEKLDVTEKVDAMAGSSKTLGYLDEGLLVSNAEAYARDMGWETDSTEYADLMRKVQDRINNESWLD